MLSSHRLQSFYQPKIEQSKIQAEVSGLNNPGTSAFYFPVFHSQSHLPFALCFLSVFKRRKRKYERKAENENTRKQRIYKENSNPTPIQTYFKRFLFLPFIGTVSNDVADLKPEKEQRTRQKKSNLKV